MDEAAKPPADTMTEAAGSSPAGADAIGAVVVVGAGISGMQAALDLAEGGYAVTLADASPAIGGVMSQLDKTFPTNDCSMCIMSPKLVEAGRHLDITVVPGAELMELTGEPGDFRARIRVRARYVDLEACTACGDCAAVCPVELLSSFDAALAPRKAAYKLYPQAVPNAYGIEKLGVSPCRQACPAGTNAHGYVALISQGKFAEALEVVRRRMPFPGACGRVCHHPCETECNRKEYDDPVAIMTLKRAAWDHGWPGADPIPDPAAPADPPAVSGTVAVIGGGPAGLTAAADLRALGYQVTIFESAARAGGQMFLSIPRYRLADDVVRKDVEHLLAADVPGSGSIELRTGVTVGRDVTLADLRRDYQAVLIAVGLQRARGLGIPGASAQGVVLGLEFLRDSRANQGPDLSGKQVTVIGGGNVAMDAARSALRLGATVVNVACLEARHEMPAHDWEIEEAIEEGVEIGPSWGPAEIHSANGAVTGIRLQRCISVFDTAGRFAPTYDPEVVEELPADLVILAIGQAGDTSLLEGAGAVAGIQTGPGGTIAADPIAGTTGAAGVFACGDVVSGPASIVEAVAAGHEAAISISRYLEGQDLAAGRPAPAGARLGAPEGRKVVAARRRHEPSLPAAQRRGDWREVYTGYSRDEAIAEASRCLDCAACSECLQCVAACLPKCIEHNQVDEYRELKVGAVILSPGAMPANPSLRPEYGYGTIANVVTSIEFERMLSASGPFEGELLRPSDGEHPKKVAFISCVGSREKSDRRLTNFERADALAGPRSSLYGRPADLCGEEYCSSVCCMYTAKEAVIAQEHVAGLEATVFYMDIRSYGKEFDRYIERAQNESGVRYIRSLASTLREVPDSKDVMVRYQQPDGSFAEESFDLVVLAVGLRPPVSAKEMAQRIGVDLNEYGFARTREFEPTATSRPGVFVCGTFAGPKDIPETVTEGSAAAAAASRLLAGARGSLTKQREFPPERDVSREEPRIGVLVCQCGRNIASVIDSAAVAQWSRRLSGVVWADSMLYTCSQDSIEKIKEAVVEQRLNRVVVASCTPRTHEALFRETIREAGLNPYLFEMANIREQASWVHRDFPQEATDKARDLVAAAVAKARLLQPVQIAYFDIIRRALVAGGGASGMTAALSLAEQGYEVYLVEREQQLGGNLRHHHLPINGEDPQVFLRGLVAKVEGHPLIHVLISSEVTGATGFVGNYRTTVAVQKAEGPAEEVIEHGVAIIATGAQPGRPPEEYLYGRHPDVLTQLELDEVLARGRRGNAPFRPGVVAMIQCAGSRLPERPYCSRVCCVEAVRHALAIKERDPEAQVYVFYRDVRTYGFAERDYRLAREAGVVFIEYDPDAPPVVEQSDTGQLALRAQDPSLPGLEIVLRPDIVALAEPIVPDVSTPLLQAFKLPLSADGFLLEAHMKLRPVDFATDGAFLCGLAHGPKSLAESLTQAQAASVRAAALLSAKQLESGGNVARVNDRLCRGCGVCVDICTYEARVFDDKTGVAKVLQVLCQGCGACVAACPSGACEQDGFTKKQITAMLEAVLGLETLGDAAAEDLVPSDADQEKEAAGQ